jgi:hypothetical protein
MYRGILAIVTFLISLGSWIFVVGYPTFRKNHTQKFLFIKILIFSIIGFFSGIFGLMGLWIPTILIIGIAVCIEIALLLNQKSKSFLPLCAGIFWAGITTPILIFCKMAYDMWNRQWLNGSLINGKEISMFEMHIGFIIMLVILAITLSVRLFKHFSEINHTSSIGSMIFLFCISISFFYTIPRYGDEGLGMLWVFIIVPFFASADLGLLGVIIVFIITTIRQKRNVNCSEILQDVVSVQTGQQLPKVASHLVLAILVTLFCLPFLPFGIVSIVYAAQVNSKLAAGDYNGSLDCSKKAATWGWIGFAIGLIFNLAGFIIVLIFKHHSTSYN